MLATFIIGLREGLEAALIVGMVAAFLRKNGRSLAPMWAGVALAALLSVAVGIGLDLVERSLPQAGQEGMEAVIGLIATVFVTGMIAWMNAHGRDLKRQIESEAARALGRASAYALAGMAFLAVLREGFETSVFLLSTFSAARSAALAAAGAASGLMAAAAVGWAIYLGVVRINLSRFFRFTGAFLVLVAAGLVVASLRSAHEAGWLNAGQQTTIELSWLVAPGTVRSALMTGVLGIPADPRLIEVVGWLVYLVPAALFLCWPAAWRLRPRSNLDPRVGWHGFHAIERDLFRKGAITEETKSLAAELQKHVGMLDGLVRTLNYKPEDLANGAGRAFSKSSRPARSPAKRRPTATATSSTWPRTSREPGRPSPSWSREWRGSMPT